MGKKAKLTDFFNEYADRRVGTDLLISVPQLAAHIHEVVGPNLPLPFPIDASISRNTVGIITVQDGLASMFADHLGIPCVMRVGESLRAGRHVTTHAYYKAEVCEWLWTVLASYIDAKILSALSRITNARTERRGSTKQRVDALKGDGWPRNDSEWARGARFILSTQPSAIDLGSSSNSDCSGDPLLQHIALDDVIDYLSEACSHASGASVDKSVLHQHFGPICLVIEPSLFLAKTLVKGKILEEVIGKSLAIIARRRQYESDWFVVVGVDESDTIAVVSQELFDSRKQHIDVKVLIANGRLDRLPEICGRSLVIATNTPKLSTWRADKTFQSKQRRYDDVRALVAANMGFTATAFSSKYYTQLAMSGSAECSRIASTYGLRLNILHVEEALEMYIAREISRV
jgi:hypothetical protein